MRLWVQSLAMLSVLRIRRCRELWCRSQTWLRPMLLWLWHRPVAIAPIRPLAWKPPYAMRVAQENGKKTKKKKYVYINYVSKIIHPQRYFLFFVICLFYNF